MQRTQVVVFELTESRVDFVLNESGGWYSELWSGHGWSRTRSMPLGLLTPSQQTDLSIPRLCRDHCLVPSFISRLPYSYRYFDLLHWKATQSTRDYLDILLLDRFLVQSDCFAFIPFLYVFFHCFERFDDFQISFQVISLPERNSKAFFKKSFNTLQLV